MIGKLIKIANEKYDGHFTLMKFTDNWRCCFGTLNESNYLRAEIEQMAEGKTMDEAILNCITNNIYALEFKQFTFHSWLESKEATK